MFTITKANSHAVAQPIAFSGQMFNPQTDVDMTQTLQAKNPMALQSIFQGVTRKMDHRPASTSPPVRSRKK